MAESVMITMYRKPQGWNDMCKPMDKEEKNENLTTTSM
jgi:hypothetical protein